MLRVHKLIATFACAAAAGVLVGCNNADLEVYPEPLAANETSGNETAQQFIDHVRLGHGVDVEGQVSRDYAASGFVIGEPIWVSMGVAEAPPGSVIHVTVRDDATNRAVWVQQKRVEAGLSYLNFVIETDLSPADYRADVIFGDEVIVGKEFRVLERRG